jgi:hypothetical protein
MAKEKLVTDPRWAPDTRTDWPTDCRSKVNFNFRTPKNLYKGKLLGAISVRSSIELVVYLA